MGTQQTAKFARRTQGDALQGAWLGADAACGTGWQARMVRVDGRYWRPGAGLPLGTMSTIHACAHVGRSAVATALARHDLSLAVVLRSGRCITTPILLPPND